MNVHLPPAPSGAKGVPGAGEGPHGRQDKLDGDFAAALAETAGESSDEAVREETGAGKADDAGGHFHVGRRLAARGGHETHERMKGDGAMPRADVPNEPDTETQVKGIRRADHKAIAKGIAANETQEAGEKPAALSASDPAQGAAAAREVLAVLGIDLTARPERAQGPELAAVARKGMGPRGADPAALGVDRVGAADVGDEVEVDEAMVLPVRVVRQEKHFQAAGVEARRWQIAQDAFEAGRAAAPTAESPKTAPGEALRERAAAPVAMARTVEAVAPVAGPAAPGAVVDVAPGAVGLQIADRVQEALTRPADSAASSSPASGTIFEADTRQSFAPALRVIKLQLNPAELGAVTIVLSGNDEGLRIELAAELADTVTKVDNDRNVLAARLSGAGYAGTDISIARMAGQGTDGDARDQGARPGGQQEQLLGGGARDGGGRHGGAQQAEQHADWRSGKAFGRADSAGSLSPGAAPAPVIGGVSYGGRFRPV